MDIHFNCPRCNQHLAVDEAGAGITLNFPSCNEQINIPRGTASPPPPLPVPVPTTPQAPPPARGRMVRCKDCGNMISPRAASCPACGAPVKRGNYAAAVVFFGLIAFF